MASYFQYLSAKTLDAVSLSNQFQEVVLNVCVCCHNSSCFFSSVVQSNLPLRTPSLYAQLFILTCITRSSLGLRQTRIHAVFTSILWSLCQRGSDLLVFLSVWTRNGDLHSLDKLALLKGCISLAAELESSLIIH